MTSGRTYTDSRSARVCSVKTFRVSAIRDRSLSHLPPGGLVDRGRGPPGGPV